LVYHFFIKIVGIILFLIEIVWFIAIPVYKELGEWMARVDKIKARSNSRKRILKTLCVLFSVILVLIVPWSGKVQSKAILRNETVLPYYVPTGSRLDYINTRISTSLNSGDTLVKLYMPELEYRYKLLSARKESLLRINSVAGFDSETRKTINIKGEEIETVLAQLESLNNDRERYYPTALFNGQLYLDDPELTPGQWISARERLGVLVNRDHALQIETFLDEESVKRIKKGNSALFITDSGYGAVKARVSSIDADSTRILPDGMLISQNGGHILARNKDGKIIPEFSIYRVLLTVTDNQLDTRSIMRRGSLTIDAAPESIASRYFRNLVAIIIRESGM
jgi:putative peptide zinc metalloprotease protein